MGPTTIDRAAFDQTILPLQPGLMRLALGLTRDAGEARDLVQDAFERALREWTRFTPGTNARAWLSAILSRLFIDRWRRRKREPRFVDIDGMPLASTSAPDGSRTPWTRAPEQENDDESVPRWAAVTESELRAAIGRLPLKLRQVFELSVTERKTYVEISQLLEIPVNTVGTRLLRARRQLRACLERALRAEAKRAHTLVPAPQTGWAPVLRAREAVTSDDAPLSPTLSPLRGATERLDIRAA